MKKLRIAQISPLRFPVPDPKRGGNERIIHYLTEELQKRGHQVTLFAAGDSKTKAKLVSVIKKSLGTVVFDANNHWWNLFNHSFAFEKANEFDIIHCHWDLMGAMFQRFVKTPVVSTSHYIYTPQEAVHPIFEYYKDDLNMVFIADKQTKNSNIKFKNSWVIANGINISDFKFHPKPQNHLVWVGRMVTNKFAKEAIEVAKKTGDKLFLAGQIEDNVRWYFEKEIKPQLNSKIQYVGELSQKELSDFYGSAKACLYPMGLVTLESMACGTPVVSKLNRKIGPNAGFQVTNLEEAAQAVKKIDSIKRENCREWVEGNFTVQKMADDYENVYYEIIKRHKAKK